MSSRALPRCFDLRLRQWRQHLWASTHWALSTGGTFFFKVVKSDYTRRFTLGDDASQNAPLAAARLRLVGRSGPSGVFQAQGGVERLNMLDVLHRAGVAALLRGLTVWRVAKTTMLAVHLASVGSTNPRALEWNQAATMA